MEARSIMDSLDGMVEQAVAETRGLRESFVVDGDPVVAIPRVAADRRIDLIVMRSRRWQHPPSLMGSIAEAISRMSPCPVLIIHSQKREPNESKIGLPLRRVLVAYDFSSDAELALSYGLNLSHKHGAEMHLLHTLPARLKTDAPELAMLPLSSRLGFDEIKARLRSAVSGPTGLRVAVRHEVREGQPYREVLNYAEEQAIDLICMGASGTGFGLHALFGSNADRVLRQARCPVIIARPLRPSLPATS